MLPHNLPSHSFHPKRLNPGFNNWLGHLPFARDLIGSLRPASIVELGTHYGESYFGFCQAVVESDGQCACYAVDTWKGDEHAGFYGEDVFADVKEYNNKYYRSFSKLLRLTFDEAAARFENGSLDMLHIDGLHTYNAVARDVHTWFPKIRPGGVMLLHDIEVRGKGFEVWRLWEELEAEFPTFAFSHNSGLGVLRKPGAAQGCNDLLSEVLRAGPEGQEEVRRYYSSCATWLARLAEEETRRRTLEGLLAEKEKQLSDATAKLGEITSQAAHHSSMLEASLQKDEHGPNLGRKKTAEAALDDWTRARSSPADSCREYAKARRPQPLRAGIERRPMGTGLG